MNEPAITLYVRDACTLCDDAEATLRAILRERGERAISIVNIETDDDLHRRLVADIPAIEAAGKLLANANGRLRIERFIDEALTQR